MIGVFFLFANKAWVWVPGHGGKKDQDWIGLSTSKASVTKTTSWDSMNKGIRWVPRLTIAYDKLPA